MDVYDSGKTAEILALWPGQTRVDLSRTFGLQWGYGVPCVGDHKTTKDEKYIKSEAELRQDEQLLGYGMEALRRTGAPGVCFQWVYYLTTGEPRAFPVRFWLPAEVLRREWAALEKIAQEMVDVVQIGNYRDVIANKDACSNYGGCYYRPLCRAKGDAMQDAKIWSKLNKPAAPGPTPSVPVAPAAVTVSPAQVNPPTVAPRFKRPDAPAPVAVTAPVDAPEASPQPAPEVTAIQVATPTQAPEAKPKRGRKPKTELATPEILDAAANDTPTLGSGFVLLVDCGIDKGGIGQQILDVFGAAMAKVAEANQQPNWRFIPYTAGAALAAAVEEQIETEGLSGFVRLDTHTPEGVALLPLLAARAFLVVRGFA
jgi:hypothetical protein